MATQTGSTYISESMIDIIKIPTTNLRFSTTASSKKLSPGNCDNDRQPEMASLAPKPLHCHFCLSFVVAVALEHFRRARRARKSQISCRRNFDAVTVPEM